MNRTSELLSFFKHQLTEWPQARLRFDALKTVRVKEIMIGDFPVRVQFNPARAASSTAKVDKVSVAARPCFLCRTNRPSEQMIYKAFDGYETLVNPFPIFPVHFTIASEKHDAQDVADIMDMADIVMQLPGMVVFYNGSTAGASAPDHLHFQSGNVDFLPICKLMQSDAGKLLKSTSGYKVYYPDYLPMQVLHFISHSVDAEMLQWFGTLLPESSDESDTPQGKRNLMMWVGDDGLLHTLFFPRSKHRPLCYFNSNEEKRLLVSPGAVDMAGVIILTRDKDFDNISKADIRAIYDEVSYHFIDQPCFRKLMLL